MFQFVERPRRVTARLEQACRWAFPGINDAPYYRPLLEYFLFSTWQDKRNPNSRRIVITQNLIYKIAPHARGNRSMSSLLDAFERDMPMRLNRDRHSWDEGLATTVDPDLPLEVQEALMESLEASLSSRNFSLATGERVSGRSANRANATRQARERAIDAIAGLDSGKEKTRLIKVINERSPRYVARLIRKAVGETRKLISSYPHNDAATGAFRRYTLALLDSIENDPFLVYSPSVNTQRIHAVAETANMLPRLVRKLLLALAVKDHPERCVELDLGYVHLAIAAWRWQLPKLHRQLTECLNSGRSIWPVFLDYCGLCKNYKPIIKTTIYSICYGMGSDTLRKQFLDGCFKSGQLLDGVGDKAVWKKFCKHPIIKELMNARRQEAAKVETDRGCSDASGDWICTLNDDGSINTPSVMSITAQSWEQHLMHAMVNVLEHNKQIYVLSWLHDGVTLYFGDHTKMKRQLDAILNAVAQRAADMGIPTKLEMETLDAAELRVEVEKLIDSASNTAGVLAAQEVCKAA